MFRLFIWLLLAIVGVTLLRSVIGMAMKLFTHATSESDSASSAARPTNPPQNAIAELKPCSLCGAYVPEQNALELQRSEKRFLFCSQKCKTQFATQN
jgi:hypothetical protein